MPSACAMVFALDATRSLGLKVAAVLGVALAAHEAREFEDGEHKLRPIDPVANRDVYVLQSLYADAERSVNDKLVRLLFFLGAVRDAGASRVTAVLPYLAYARKDARTQPNDPLSSRYIAQMLEALGVDCTVAVEVHNPAAFQNAFRIRAEHIPSTAVFADAVIEGLAPGDAVTVISPDPGGFKRADQLRVALSKRLGREVPIAFMEKRRAQGKLSVGRLVGEVSATTAVIVDDIVATGSTLAAAAAECRAHGARQIVAAATHGLFVPPADRVLAAAAIDRVLVSDSVPPFRLEASGFRDRVEIVSIAPLLARTVDRLHRGAPLADLAA